MDSEGHFSQQSELSKVRSIPVLNLVMMEKIRLVIADDEVTTRISLCLAAENWGYSTISAQDGREVLKILEESYQNPPQIFLIDWIMPEVDGLEVCRRIRANRSTENSYVLMLTARSGKQDAIEALEAGADDFIKKPFLPNELRARLKTAERIVNLQQNLENRIAELQNTLESLRQTKHDLRRSEEYQNLFKHANDSIIVFDPITHEILKVNDKACLTYQISPENFVGKSFLQLVADEKFHQVMVNLTIRHTKVEEFEAVHLRADQKPLNMLINCSLIEFKGRQAILSVGRDVTEKRFFYQMIEKALLEWSETVDAVSDMIIMTEADGNIRRCNIAASEFFGKNFNDLIGKNIYELCGFSRPQTETEFKKSPFRQKKWEGQVPICENEWFEITNNRVRPSENYQDNNYWVHVVKNITERKLSELSLRLLNAALEHAADSIIVTDKKGFVEYVNPAFSSSTGWTMEEAIGCHMSDLQAAGLKELLSKKYKEFKLPEKAWQGSYLARKKNGVEYEEEITISPIKKDQNGEVLNYVAVCRDITERRRLESIAEAVNMMENVGYVFSGIRHELGNPINSVKTALSVLKKNLFQWEISRVETYVDRSLTEIERVEYLLRALKTFSMYEKPQMEKINLTDFIRNFITLVEEDFQKIGIEIRMESAEDVGEAIFDSRALHQVLLNLFTNSADALKGREEPAIVVSLKRNRGRAYICIADNGCGMTPYQMDNLFKPFYTSKEKGTGLGLVIVKKMITKMNGTIGIESVYDEGTKVYLTLEAAK